MPVFDKAVVKTQGGLVAAQSVDAAAAGADVLRRGGNAVDAAVATSLALGVTEPWMSGVGGGCAALIKPPGEPAVAVDGGMVAPRALDVAAYPLTGAPGPSPFAWPGVVDDRNVTGPLAVAVPGLVAALGAAHERFGRLAWHEALEPAVERAETGHAGDWYTTLKIANDARLLRGQPASAAYFLADGLPPAGEPTSGRFRLDMSALARTYRRLAEAGASDFYQGVLAERLLGEARAMATWLRASDLESYAARLHEPRVFAYRQARLTTMDGLFAGLSLEEALGVVAARWSGGQIDVEAYAAYALGLRRAYATRLERLGHAAEPGNTSHFCVIDADGMLVAWTQTLLSLFGSHVYLPETGILLNNGIMWFDPRPGTPNALAPGAQPLSNMCPTLIEGAPGGAAVLGACGGRRILSAVLQLASFLIDAGDDLEAAFHRPRIDVSGPDAAIVDVRLGEDILKAVGEVVPATAAADGVQPTPFALPSAILLSDDGERSGASSRAHPWAGAVAA